MSPYFIVIASLIPITFAVVGLITWLKPPKTRNGFFGWRTRNSFKSQEAWDYANTQGGKSLCILGIVLELVTLLFFLALRNINPLSLFSLLALVMVVQFLIFIIDFIIVDKKIGQKFN